MTTRREFLKTMTMASAGLALGAGEYWQNAHPLHRKERITDKVKIAYVGIGNRGEQIIGDFARTGMVEGCSICVMLIWEQPHTQKVMNLYPKAKRFRDFSPDVR